MVDNADQSAFWDQRADAWERHADAMEEFAGWFGDPAIDALGPTPGQRLADVGCGPGTTTVELGRRVGPGGSVIGIDVSRRMVEAGRARARAAGLENVQFEVGDPGIGPIGPFDGVYSRFGLMFFDEPIAAFTNLAQSIASSGRLVTVVWAELDANPWMFVPTLFGAGPLGAELTLPGPGEPGPFSLADPKATVSLLEACGFRDVDVSRKEHFWGFGEEAAEDSISQMLSVGPLGDAWIAASDDIRRAAVEAVLTGCDGYRHGDDWRLPAAAFVVAASTAS